MRPYEIRKAAIEQTIEKLRKQILSRQAKIDRLVTKLKKLALKNPPKVEGSQNNS